MHVFCKRYCQCMCCCKSYCHCMFCCKCECHLLLFMLLPLHVLLQVLLPLHVLWHCTENVPAFCGLLWLPHHSTFGSVMAPALLIVQAENGLCLSQCPKHLLMPSLLSCSSQSSDIVVCEQKRIRFILRHNCRGAHVYMQRNRALTVKAYLHSVI